MTRRWWWLGVAGLLGGAGCQSAAGKRLPADDGADGAAGAAGSDGGGGAGVDVVCDFVVSKSEIAAKMPTVGVVEWSLRGARPTTAQVLYSLDHAGAATLNRTGVAPVNLDAEDHRTLLLGLKPTSDYSFQIEAVRDGHTCRSETFVLPTTGRFSVVPTLTRTVTQPEKRSPGFIVTSSGTSLPASAFIIDADGDIVWYAEGPQNPTRARMDYEGQKMWMVQLNLTNQVGEMRYVSMDGESELRNVPGLERAHHDFTVMPDGRVAALAWAGPGVDPPSELLIRSPDGAVVAAFEIGSAIYRTDTYHANAVHYLPFDDSFTIADRNPSVFVKVSAQGFPQWQLGGACDAAPAGASCFASEFRVTHGHHLLADGTFLAFDNHGTEPARVWEFRVQADPGRWSATAVRAYAGTAASSNLGDVQRLPNGNTLITYSATGHIVEVDPDWHEVQTFSVRVGYTSWRPTLYGPPPRP